MRITVYLRANSTDHLATIVNDQGQIVNNPDYQKIYNQIMSVGNVSTITFSSKDEQLTKLTENMGDTWNLFKGDANPLYDAYIIDTTTPESVKTVASAIVQIDGVTEVRDGEVQTERLFELSDMVSTWGGLATGLLLLTAILLISNTIRITIISRSREIQIMRLVGAKNSYIRGPFLFEGAWVGLLGAIVPASIIYVGYQMVYQSINKGLASQNLSLIDIKLFVPAMIGSLFLVGIVIGALGSVISMRRFLKI